MDNNKIASECTILYEFNIFNLNTAMKNLQLAHVSDVQLSYC